MAKTYSTARTSMLMEVESDILRTRMLMDEATAIWETIIASGEYDTRSEDLLCKKLSTSWFQSGLPDRAVLDSLKTSLLRLGSAVDSLIDTVEVTSTQLALHAEGIKLLPADVLWRVCDHLDSPFDVLKFGAVCRSFREVSTRPSAGWTRLRSNWSFRFNELCVKRSGIMPLVIEIVSLDKNTVDGFVDSIPWRRCTKLVVDRMSGDFSPREDYTNLCARVAALDLSNLSSLELRQLYTTHHPSATYGFDSPGNTFLQSLAIPLVERLVLENTLPSGMRCSITFLDLKLSASYLHYSVRPLLDFLRRTTTLKTFLLDMEDVKGIVFPNVFEMPQTVSLPHIEEFTFAYRYHSGKGFNLTESIDHISRVLAAFTMPNLMKLDLVVCGWSSTLSIPNGIDIYPNLWDARDEHELLSCRAVIDRILPGVLDCGRLQHFRMCAEVLEWKRGVCDLTPAWNIPIGPLCSAETYELSTILNPVFHTNDLHTVPDSRLRRIILSNCVRMTSNDFGSLIMALQIAGAFDTLHAIDIIQCPKLKEVEDGIRDFVTDASSCFNDLGSFGPTIRFLDATNDI